MTRQKITFSPHEKGDTFYETEIQLEINGENPDLDGAKVEMNFKHAVSGDTETMTTEGDDAQLEITDNELAKFIIKEQKIDWAPGVWKFNVTYTFSDGVVRTYGDGSFTIIDTP
jgi:hypothetical protein